METQTAIWRSTQLFFIPKNAIFFGAVGLQQRVFTWNLFQALVSLSYSSVLEHPNFDSSLKHKDFYRVFLSHHRIKTPICNDWIHDRTLFNWLLTVINAIATLSDWPKSQFFNQWEERSKAIAACMRDFSRAVDKLHAGNCSEFWLVHRLFAPVVIGRNY